MLLFIVRHGDPIYNPDSLTPKGHLQAQALAKRFAVNGLDEIYSSPLNRAKQTAQPTCDILGKPYTVEDWTSETKAADDLFCTYPDGHRGWVFQRQLSELKNNSTLNFNMQNWYTADCFKHDAERYKKGFERIGRDSDLFLARLGYERDGAVYKILNPNNKRVAVFCHHGFGVTWLSHLLQIPPHIFWSSFNITHSGVTVLRFKNYENGITVPQCLCLSDTSHILREGLPFEYNNSEKL